MSEHNKTIQEFLQTACNQIRYKSVHKSIINELTDHIEEQKNQYIKEGLSEEDATKKAIEQMGDPVLVGKELDKAHRPRTEWSILSLVAILVLIGGGVQLLISTTSTMHTDSFINFLTYLPFGLAAFFFTYFFDYTLLGRYPKIAYFILMAAAITESLLTGPVHGCYSHIYYFAMLFIPIFAGIVYSFRNKGYFGIIACGIFYFGAAFLCLIAPRVSAFVLLTFSCLIVLTIAIVKGYFGGSKKIGLAIVYIPTLITFILSMLYLFSQQYLLKRIALFLNPELDPLGNGYQFIIIKRIISRSQLFGEVVLGPQFNNSRVNEILPGLATDFSLTYIIGRLGLVAGLAIVIIISFLIVRISTSIIKQKNTFGHLLSCSACLAIAGQFILYVLSNFGVFIVFSSVTLPFISFGGTGFVVNMILIGLVMSVYRRTNIVIDNMQINTSNWQLISFENGKIIIDLDLITNKKPLS
jgi:cell division protein FtsW (lipid II flippase)